MLQKIKTTASILLLSGLLMLMILGLVYLRDHFISRYFGMGVLALALFAIALIFGLLDSEDEQP